MADKIAVLTGASRGLGRSMAVHLARAGIAIVGTYRNRRDDADSVIEAVEAAGGQAVMLPLDVGDSGSFPAFVASVADTLASTFGRTHFDFLVNNAGLGIRTPYVDTTEEQFDELVRVQLKGPYFLTQKLLPLIVDGGRILNVSSGLARFTLPGYSAYAATKGAIEVLTRYQARELGERQIRVNVIAPGATETDFAGGATRDVAGVNAAIASTVPLGRAGLPDDIGAAVAALLSEGFGWANGSRIEISGGQNV
jgi:NAD(P)-dependent dehydrogenase (short-subunit alcohol dehydrogenase family)